MYRTKIEELLKWKNKTGRKPLIVRGARQVGKTWLIKEFGRLHYKNIVYVNFENTPELQSIFESDFDIDRIILTLQMHARIVIKPEDTLIFFDEIQSAPRGLTSLKYFCEDAPQYHVIAAGSLLGMGLHANISFPVGKVNFIDMHPLTFFEFLCAMGEEMIANAIHSKQWDALYPFESKLREYLKTYFYVGGMPEVVQAFVNNHDLPEVRSIQREILNSYEADFSKHAPNDIVPRIYMAWRSIPSQLSKENKKFVYGIMRDGARAKDFELAIEWLCNCGLFLKAHRIKEPRLPLTAYQDLSTFKIFIHDVGLLSAMAALDMNTLIGNDRVFTEFKGALTEQYVMQELHARQFDYIGYWTNERSTAEVDFIIQSASQVIPIEVKAETNVHAKSFRLFCTQYTPTTAYRTSMLPYKDEQWMTNIPLWAIWTI